MFFAASQGSTVVFGMARSGMARMDGRDGITVDSGQWKVDSGFLCGLCELCERLLFNLRDLTQRAQSTQRELLLSRALPLCPLCDLCDLCERRQIFAEGAKHAETVVAQLTRTRIYDIFLPIC
jgi:hypothetical protein